MGVGRGAAAEQPQGRGDHPRGQHVVDGDLALLDPGAYGRLGARDVAVHAAESPAGQAGFVRNLFQSLVKQPPTAYTPELLERWSWEAQERQLIEVYEKALAAQS